MARDILATPKSDVIGIRLPLADVARFKAIAAAKGLTDSALGRNVLLDWIDKAERKEV